MNTALELHFHRDGSSYIYCTKCKEPVLYRFEDDKLIGYKCNRCNLKWSFVLEATRKKPTSR